MDEDNMHKNEATQVDTKNLGEKKKTMIQDILDLMKDNSRIKLRGFNKIDRYVLAEWSRKVNRTKAYQNWKYFRYKYRNKSSHSLCRKKDWS